LIEAGFEATICPRAARGVRMRLKGRSPNAAEGRLPAGGQPVLAVTRGHRARVEPRFGAQR
jgi:hypothetical protein